MSEKKKIVMFGSSAEFNSGWSPSYFPTACGVSDDPYFDLFNEVDALLSKEFDIDDFEFKYVDITTPEILDYMNDINTIVDNDLTLPYISINSIPIVFGEADPKIIFEKIKEKLENAWYIQTWSNSYKNFT